MKNRDIQHAMLQVLKDISFNQRQILTLLRDKHIVMDVVPTEQRLVSELNKEIKKANKPTKN